MADVSKEKLRGILAQAEAAAKKLRSQRDHVLALQFLLADDDPPGDAARLQELKDFVSGQVEKCHREGLEACAGDLTAVLTMAAASGARLAPNSSFPVLAEEELHAALLAHAEEMPAGSTAFSRIEAALFAVKLAQEHHLPRCVEHVAQITIPGPDAAAAAGEPLQAGTGGETGLPSPAPAKEDKVPQETGDSLDRALDYADRAFILVDLAVKHVDLAAAAMSSFLDPAAAEPEKDDAMPGFLDPAAEPEDQVDDAKQPSDDSDDFDVIT